MPSNPKRLLEDLKSLLGRNKVIEDEAIVRLYSREPSGLESPALAVVFPETTGDVSRLAKYAYSHDLRLFPQGSSTSLSGSAVPLDEGVVVTFEHMNRVREISVVDSITVVEPGVRIDELNLELAGKGYMFPVDPASSAVATVGGAINSGAGGMRSAKYGTMRDWVLGLEIVLPDEHGSVLRLGCRTLKCRQGYDLVRLIVGSEGTLAMVTEAVLKIAPLPEQVVVALAFYPELRDVAEAVVAVKEQGVQPYIMEFMDDRTVEAAAKTVEVSVEASGHMFLVGVDVNREAAERTASWLSRTLSSAGATRLYVAGTVNEAEERGFFTLRRSLLPAQMRVAREITGSPRTLVYIGDIAVPPSKLVDAVEELRSLEAKYGLFTMIGGHIGDGNLHPAVGLDPRNKEQARRVEEWYLEVMELALKLGGTISSEHGIGLLKREGLRREFQHLGSEKALELMKGLKRLFDPKGVLNPGKVV